MIISFSVENFLSFKEEIHFSMIANGREQQHIERVPKLTNWNKKILPVSALYGGNASGKSNFVKAIGFAQKYILLGISKDEKIELKPFKLCSESMNSPSKFIFQLLINDTIYEYGFEITPEEVQREWLTKVGKKTDKVIYQREKNSFKFNFGKLTKKSDNFVNFLAESTLSNKLFLSNVKDSRIEEYRELNILQSVYEWFINLQIIRPEESFSFSERYLSDDSMMNFISNLLQQLDTGISSFEIKKIRIPKENFKKIDVGIDFQKLNELGMVVRNLEIEEEVNHYKIRKKISHHLDDIGNPIEFNLTEEESDGTNRLVDLLPAFYFLCLKKQEKVFIIDEFNRSLHPLLSQKLLKAYLSCCNESTRSQLIFTSHDVMLLDQKLFRRDEIWFTERNSHGASRLSSLSDFKNVRSDKKLRNDYLLGRFDGIPDIMLPIDMELSDSTEVENDKGGDT